MDQPLEQEIRRLYSCFHSSRDPLGRTFVPLADAYRRAGDLLRARLLLEEGLLRHPDFASAHVVALRVARDVSDHGAAAKSARRVLGLDPGNTEARGALDDIGSMGEDAPGSTAPSASGDEGEATHPDESWMAGDAGVWGAGTDSGLASVDPAALVIEDERARSLARTSGSAGDAAGPAPSAETVAPVVAATPEEPVADVAEEEPVAETDVTAPEEPGAAPPPKPSFGSGGAGDDAGIRTRTMGRLYEQQGLYTHAIAVYERILETEPGDAGLSRRLERVRQRAVEELSVPSRAARRSAGAPVQGRDALVVAIDSLAPDPPPAGPGAGTR